MNNALIQDTLWQKRKKIAKEWQKSLSSFENHTQPNIDTYYLDLVEKCIAVLVSNPFDNDLAHAIGESLAISHHTHPSFLAQFIPNIGNSFVAGLTPEQQAFIHPNLIQLINQFLYSYGGRAYSLVMADQERMNKSIMALQQKARELSGKQDANWQNLFSKITNPLIIHDGNRILNVNEAAYQLLGYEREPLELMGKPVLQLFAPWTHNNIHLAFNTARVTPYETAVSHKDGSTITVQFYNWPLYYQQQDNFVFLFEVLARPKQKTSSQINLTQRELQVLKAIVSDQNDEVAANALGITPRTIRFHLQNIFRKFDVSSRAAAVNKAWQLGILKKTTDS